MRLPRYYMPPPRVVVVALVPPRVVPVAVPVVVVLPVAPVPVMLADSREVLVVVVVVSGELHDVAITAAIARTGSRIVSFFIFEELFGFVVAGPRSAR